jgi:DNA-binding transcriptional regulator YiaG
LPDKGLPLILRSASGILPANDPTEETAKAMKTKKAKAKKMKPEEYRRCIDGLGMTQVEAAHFFSVDERTSRRWASGEVPIPFAIKVTLGLLAHFKTAPATALDIVGEL